MKKSQILEQKSALNSPIVSEYDRLSNSETHVPSEFSEIIDTTCPIDISYDKLIDICQEKELRILPLDANKSPYVPNWNTEKIDYKFVRQELKTGAAKAIGLVTGEVSDDIVCLDFDGVDEEFAKKHIFIEQIPPTVIITSGKKGHFSLLFKVKTPTTKIVFQNTIKNRKVVKLDLPSTSKPDRKAEIEIRWNKHQCVIWGAHPDTGEYKTRGDNYFHNSEIAELPRWLYDRILNFSNNKEVKKQTVQSSQKIGDDNIDENDSIYNADFDDDGLLIVNDVKDHRFMEFDIDDYVGVLSIEKLARLLEIKTALEVLDTEICEDYDTWLKIGMALHHEGTTSGKSYLSDAMRELFHAWSQGSDKYEKIVTEAKWNSFNDCDDSITINTLFHHAHQKVQNVEKLTREIYPSVNNYYKSLDSLELDAQRQKLTSALQAGDSLQYMDKMPMRQRVSHYIENYMSKDLRYNLHSREFEYKGEILDIHDFHLYLVVAFNKEVSDTIFRKAYDKYSNEYAYHPFQEYIESLLDKNYKPSEEDYQNAVNYLNKVAKEYLHAQNEFEHLLFRKWMVGTVCRVLSPGYKFDGVLMLKGGQGLGKTTFFESIAGLEYYRSHLGNIDKDALAKMHRAIIIELAEIAATFGKVKNEALKNFITERVDTFRRPYGYSDIDHPRRFVFGGSTNDDEFLTDPTGSRRYWIVEINEMIDTAAIQEHRDEIFRAAYIMKLHGDEPYLSLEESVINEERNSTHKKVTLLEEAIAEIVHERMKQQEKVKDTPAAKTMFQIPFRSNDIVKDLKDTHPSLRPTSHGINAALKDLGFEQEHKRFNGTSGRWWKPTSKYYEQHYEADAS